MIWLLHIVRWILKFIKFPFQFFKLLYNDIRDDLSNLNTYKKKNFILVIGLPKSGTTLIEQILRSLGYLDQAASPLRIFDNRNLKNPHDISENMLKKVPENRLSFLKLHSHFSEDNLRLIEKYNPKVIISFRNLKDVLISRYNHIISDKKHRHHAEIVDLDYNDGLKKSLIIQNSNDTPVKPLDYFFFWIKDWKNEIKKRNLNFLALDYENYNLNKKKYIKSILNYIGIKDVNIDELLVKIESNYKKIKNNNLEKNLKNFIKPQTFNKNSNELKKKLRNDEVENFILKNLPK
tara:strand:- start:967 stop:1842 length:876 start_codon:yes stop_codon:yes gene_type:complete